MAESHSSKKPFRPKQRRHTEEQKQEMIRCYQAGTPLQQIADSLGCCRETVRGILLRRGIKRRTPGEAKTGHPLSEETRRKISSANKGKSRGVGRKNTAEVRRKMSEIARARGERHNFRIDGKGDERRTERKASMQQMEYRLWREAVYARDNWTCQECKKRGGKLAADHVKPWRDFPELRYDVSNGRTLCEECHKKTPTYGGRIFNGKRS